ncbi:MAG: succinate dehydrogenase cytochrome b subunit [Marinilabiliaceae bacterium]|nr:succinate dehydrogenase cytochrome b subunit [Marinilabiliaceae bacterium]
MSNLFCSSIGKKLLMSISGLFLITFLLLHLTLNSFLLIPDGGEMFNAAAHFMATNPLIKVMEPILVLGFVVHIIYAGLLTLQNSKARGNQRYASGSKTLDVSWASKNMWILGLAVLGFLVVHIANFYVKMKFTGDPLLNEASIIIGGVHTEVENAYALVNKTFSFLWVVIVYVIGSVALAIHLSHGFWSGFQTIGFSNEVWRVRLNVVGAVIAWIIGLGFALIAVLQYLFYQV